MNLLKDEGAQPVQVIFRAQSGTRSTAFQTNTFFNEFLMNKLEFSDKKSNLVVFFLQKIAQILF